MSDDQNVTMEQIRSYADRLLAAVPAPTEAEGGDRVLMPALAFASVMLLWAAAREDWQKMYSLMKAYHQSITAFHQSVVRADSDRRKAAKAQARKEGAADDTHKS